jgi:hypothetical protein
VIFCSVCTISEDGKCLGTHATVSAFPRLEECFLSSYYCSLKASGGQANAYWVHGWTSENCTFQPHWEMAFLLKNFKQLFLMILGTELRSLCLLGRYCTPRATPPGCDSFLVGIYSVPRRIKPGLQDIFSVGSREWTVLKVFMPMLRTGISR